VVARARQLGVKAPPALLVDVGTGYLHPRPASNREFQHRAI